MTMTKTLIYDPAKKLNCGCIMSFHLNANSLHYIIMYMDFFKKNQFELIYKYVKI